MYKVMNKSVIEKYEECAKTLEGIDPDWLDKWGQDVYEAAIYMLACQYEGIEYFNGLFTTLAGTLNNLGGFLEDVGKQGEAGEFDPSDVCIAVGRQVKSLADDLRSKANMVAESVAARQANQGGQQ